MQQIDQQVHLSFIQPIKTRGIAAVSAPTHPSAITGTTQQNDLDQDGDSTALSHWTLPEPTDPHWRRVPPALAR
jgi:hypothetical protein